MNYEQINELTVEQCNDILVIRLQTANPDLLQEDITQEMLDSELLLYKAELTLSRDNAIALYSDFTPVLAVKTITDFEQYTTYEILLLEDSLRKEDEFLVEQARLLDIKERLNAIDITDLAYVITSQNLKIKSIPHFKYQQIPSMDKTEAETFLQMIESVASENKLNRIEQDKKDQLDRYAQSIVDRCNNAMKAIISTNVQMLSSGTMTSADIDVLETMFAPALIAMQNKRPDKAIAVIESLDLTGTVYAEENRQAIIAVLRG